MDEPLRFSAVEKLIGLNREDWKYSDLYLHQAEAIFVPLCTSEQFQGLLAQRRRIGTLGSDLRHAIQRGEWSEVEQFATEGGEVRRQIARNARLLSLAEEVYGRKSFAASLTALALAGVVAEPARHLEQEVSRLSRDLRVLAGCDDSRSEFYERRAAELERMVVDLPDDPPSHVDPSDLREAALTAADESDYAVVMRIAKNAARSGQDRLGRIRAPRLQTGWDARLAQAIPEAAIERARPLGLEIVDLEPSSAFNAYLSCGCADRALLPAVPLATEHREVTLCTCGHACPPEIGKDLKSSLDALMVHPFLTSGGTRYLPWFGNEPLLVELFPEDEPDARSPLLDALSLPRRTGLPRLAIEDSLLSNGPRVCADMGLDPIDHRIICIPFDAYYRLAERHGWGGRRLWTHFDGYQLTRELKLQALVGGDIRFGGPADLCGVGRGYDSEHITVRFAVVRRDRFEARAPRGAR